MRESGEPAQAPADDLRREQAVGMNQAMRVLSYLIAGVGFYGFLGWLGDRLFDTSFLLPVGILLGAGLGIYLIMRYLSTVTDDATKTRPVPRSGDRVAGTRKGAR